MKKQKVIILNEQLNKKDSKAIQVLQQGLDKIESFPVYTPNLQWFEQMVLVEKQKIKKKLIRDLTIFVLIALFILIGISMSLYHMPYLFIILQIITTVFIGIYTCARFIKRVGRV